MPANDNVMPTHCRAVVRSRSVNVFRMTTKSGLGIHGPRPPSKQEVLDPSVQSLAQRLGFLLGATHGLCVLFKLDADPLDVDRAFVPIPGDGFDSYLRDRAAKTPVSIHQSRVNSLARGADRRRETLLDRSRRRVPLSRASPVWSGLVRRRIPFGFLAP